jgi:hypothetical protein
MNATMNDRLRDAIMSAGRPVAPVDTADVAKAARAMAAYANSEDGLAWVGATFVAGHINLVPCAVATLDGKTIKAEPGSPEWGYYEMDAVSASLVSRF